MIITIDGPAGSGKSSVAKKLAKKLNIYYLNTGLIYRAVAYIWLQRDPKLEEIDNISLEDLYFTKKIEYKYLENYPNVFYNDENITIHLSNHIVAHAASILSAKKEVRVILLELQRAVSKKYDIVAEGRDCGSVVFPYANYKFYLTATVDVRARRIFEDNNRDNASITIEKVKAELEERDFRDKNRSVAPLIVPENAIIIDNSKLNENETIRKILSFIDICN